MKDSDHYKYGYESDASVKLRNQLKFHNGNQKYLKTELKRAIKIAKKARISKRQIAAEVNHRYRTVLTSVICYSEILIDQQFGTVNETQKEFLGFIYESALELLDMINEIYDC